MGGRAKAKGGASTPAKGGGGGVKRTVGDVAGGGKHPQHGQPFSTSPLQHITRGRGSLSTTSRTENGAHD